MRRVIPAIALAVVVVFGGAPASAQQRGLGVLNGTVTTEAGEPVAGVVLKLPMADGSAVEAKTDASGRWSVSGVGKGEFQMSVVKEGYAAKVVKVVVERETMRPEPIKLTLKKAS
jgi:hypothetical protein